MTNVPTLQVTLHCTGTISTTDFFREVTTLALRRHVDLCLGSHRILRVPVTRDSLVLGVEVDTGLAVEGALTTASDGLLVTGEGEHGKRDRDGAVDQLVGTADF